MRVLRHKGHLLRDHAHASRTYEAWTTIELMQLSPTQTTTRPGTSGCTHR